MSKIWGAFTPVATPSCIAGQLLWCSFAYYGGAVIGSTAFASWTFADNVPTTRSSDALDIEEPIAANGNVASGPRVTLNVFQQQIGTSGIDATFTGSISAATLTVSSGAGIAAGQMLFGSGVTPLTSIASGGGTTWVVNNSQAVGSETMTTTGAYTCAGESSTVRLSGWMQSNLGGAPSAHQNALTTANITCANYVTATYILGCVDVEYGIEAYPGSSSFIQNVMALYVVQSNDQQESLLGATIGMEFANQAGATIGLQSLLQIGSISAAFPMAAYGRIIAAEPSYNRPLYAITTGGGIDLALMTVFPSSPLKLAVQGLLGGISYMTFSAICRRTATLFGPWPNWLLS